MSSRFATTLLLLLLAAVPLVWGALWGPLLAAAALADGSRLLPTELLRALVAALAVASMSLFASLATASCALARATGHRIGWRLGLVAAGGWLLTGCAPLSLLVLALLWMDAPPPEPSGAR